MENLSIYNAVRKVPNEAQKTIPFGPMKGKTDINPMWRIKALTEQFGPCGYGWYTEIVEEKLVPIDDGQVAAFVKINLFIMVEGKGSSMPIPGTGGNMFIQKNKNGLQVNDECFKMAYTDAISVACKALGVGADIYWDSDKTKYDVPDTDAEKKKALTDAQVKRLYTIAGKKGFDDDQVKVVIKKEYKKDSANDLSKKEYDELVKRLEAK